MNSAKTYGPIRDPKTLAAVKEKVAALLDPAGRLRPSWLSGHGWIVVPVQGLYESATGLSTRAAAVARALGQRWFIASSPPGAKSSDPSVASCHRAPVSDRGLLDVAWEYFPPVEHVITTEDVRFAIVNPEETWFLIAGPQPQVERLLGCSVDDAWAAFGGEDTPFHDNEMKGVRDHLLLYKDFFGTGMDDIGSHPIFAGEFYA